MAGPTMKLRTGLAMAFLFSLSSGCVIEITDADGHWHGDGQEVSEAFNETVFLDDQSSFRLIGANGDIRISGVEGLDRIEIRGVRRVRSDTRRDAEDHLQLLQVRIQEGWDEVLVETEQPQHSGDRSYIVDYEVTLPADLAVEVVTGNGSVTVQDMDSGAVVEAGNGNVTLSALRGSAFVAVGNGAVDATIFLPAGSKAVFAVGNGSVDLSVQEEVSAAFNARVGNGTISLTGLSLSDQLSAQGILSGRLGDGAGLIDLSVGNGWVAVKGS